MLIGKKLRKHVAIIHAYSMMSALQRKIVNVLLFESMNYKNSKNNCNSVVIECLMPFSKLAKAISFNSNNTQYLKEAIDGLASLKIEWNLLKDKTSTNISFLNLRILHGSPTFYQDGTFNFSFHKLLFDLIGNPPIYGTIDIDIQSQFESKYGHALYENSTRFVNLQKSKIIQIDTFRKLFGVNKNKYPSMRELTRNVIKPSLEEVNDRAEFMVDLKSVRAGRKITGFELIVKSKKKIFSSKSQIKNQEQSDLRKAIKQEFGTISETVLENLLNSYTEKYIFEKISYTKKHAKKEKSGFHPIPYFISALKNDYKSSEQQSEERKEQKKITEHVCVWREKLHSLQIDLGYWRRHLEYAEASSNLSRVENAKKNIQQYEENLQQHLLKQQKEKLTNEID